MTPTQDAARRSKFRFLLAAVAVVAVLAGCSSSDTSSEKPGDATEQSGNADGGAKSESSADASDEFPDGFPGDVPLPDYEKVDVINPNPEAPQVMLTIDPTLKTSGEDIMKDYAEQLGAAGLEVTGEPTGSMEADGDAWGVSFHSAMDGTLSIAVLPS